MYWFRFLFVVLLFLGGTACQDQEVKELRRDLDRLAEQLAKLQFWTEKINNDIGVLQALANVLRDKKGITSVVESSEGYLITLNDGQVLHIYQGTPGDRGKDGEIRLPSIVIRDSSDGHAYWAVGGELLFGSDGLAVRADGKKGETGENGGPGIAGTTPQVQINALTNEWEISTDGGMTWYSTGVKATGEAGEKGEIGPAGPEGKPGEKGEQGEAVFAKDGIRIEEEFVEFTLANEEATVLKIPRYRKPELVFPEGNCVVMKCWEEADIPFLIQGNGGGVSVGILENGDWQGKIEMTGEYCGVVVVTAPGQPGKAAVIVILNDEQGRVWTYSLNLTAL